VRLVDYWYDRPPVVPPSDAFFLHIEKSGIPQQVGGMVVFRPRGDGGPSLAEVRELVRGELRYLPRFRQRLEQPGRWRRARWVDSEVEWDRHVTERTVDRCRTDSGTGPDPADGGAGRVARIGKVVTELAGEPLPKDRPLWRLVLVRDPVDGAIGVVLLVHHVVADGIGTVVQALRLLRPTMELPVPDRTPPGRATTAAAIATGLAQLAVDAQPGARLPGDCVRRVFTVCSLDLETVRAVARSHHARVTDVLLAVTVTALRRCRPDLEQSLHGTVRVAVPLMVRDPSSGAEGNSTAAVMMDVALNAPSPARLLDDIRARSDRLHSGTRALASHFVMSKALRLLPEPMVGIFARSVYG
ncbi:MAG: wax ester/triacylglycerol synthase domain-containing protein, partial [Stackebrandtia sp.]